MKLENLTLRQILTGEYALGALHGRARLRFERLMRTKAGCPDSAGGGAPMGQHTEKDHYEHQK
jgi:hypothetical protein